MLIIIFHNDKEKPHYFVIIISVMRIQFFSALLFSKVIFGLNHSSRSFDPVILEGRQLPEILGAQIDTIVAFRFNLKWEQLPIQIDEKHWQSWEVIKGFNDCRYLYNSKSDIWWSDCKLFLNYIWVKSKYLNDFSNSCIKLYQT